MFLNLALPSAGGPEGGVGGGENAIAVGDGQQVDT
jgi:hypothetical protein